MVYANGESTVQTERRWLYEHSQWPIKKAESAWYKELDHTSWATADALSDCDVIHVQSALGLAAAHFIQHPALLTLHGPHDTAVSGYYSHYPDVEYVAISHAQAQMESMPKLRAIHHGIDLNLYQWAPRSRTAALVAGDEAVLWSGAFCRLNVSSQTWTNHALDLSVRF